MTTLPTHAREAKPTTLYKLYDKNGILLYVGISQNWRQRFRQHRETKDWWSEVDGTRSCIREYESWTEAVAAERLMIIDEGPKYNIVHNNGTKPNITKMKDIEVAKNSRVEEMRKIEEDINPFEAKTYATCRQEGLDFALTPETLVGSYFQRPVKQEGWQGRIVAEPSPGVYLVETYSWLMGEQFEQQLIRIETMIDESWRFYDTPSWMRYAYEHHSPYPKADDDE